MIKPYKNRIIDFDKPVKVYRNLNAPKDKPWKRFSIMQNGLVSGHGDVIILSGVEFRVSETGRQRVLRDKRKNVHAFAIGFLEGLSDGERIVADLSERVTYNPYKSKHFIHEKSGKPVYCSTIAVLSEYGAFVDFTKIK